VEQSLRIKVEELNLPLIEGLKKHLKAINAKEITISFSAPKKKYLYNETQEEAGARIKQSINDMDKGDFVFFTGEEFEQMSKALSAIK
jgi:hypothetical protein